MPTRDVEHRLVNVECAELHADALPSASVVAAFGLEGEPVPLQGGQGNS